MAGTVGRRKGENGGGGGAGAFGMLLSAANIRPIVLDFKESQIESTKGPKKYFPRN